MVATVDTVELEAKVKEMYRHVAQEPGGDYHFELGERLALRVGYDADRLRNVPAGAVESFAGVGFFFDLANLTSGETVVDLGSGSGMDALYAADFVGTVGPGRRYRLHPRTAGEGPQARRGRRSRSCGVPRGSDRVPPAARRERGLRHLQRGHQPGPRQARRVRRSGAGPAPRRTPGDRRHHHREATRPRPSSATPTSGPRASAARRSRRPICRPSSRPASRSTRSGSTPTRSSPTRPATPAPSTASRASPSSPPSQRTEPTLRSSSTCREHVASTKETSVGTPSG